jgi:hypothetical protein
MKIQPSSCGLRYHSIRLFVNPRSIQYDITCFGFKVRNEFDEQQIVTASTARIKTYMGSAHALAR